MLYRFLGGNDAATPLAGLVFDPAGNLYGTTRDGGIVCSCGTVFELSPPSTPTGSWTETILHSFGGEGEGVAPLAGLVFNSQGNLYGTTEAGSGTATYGTVFQLAPPAAPGGSWTETVLYAFQNFDGHGPFGSVVFDQYGNLYGTTFLGGAANDGVVFQLTPPTVHGTAWTETVLFNFESTDGYAPAAPVIFDDQGNLYGTTTTYHSSFRFGSVFQLATQSGGTWSFTVLHFFHGSGGSRPDGATPYAPVLLGSGRVFFGTTKSGGVSNNGTIYAVDISPVAQFSPKNLNFGDQTVNFTSSPQTVTLTNGGDSALVITNIQITGDNYGDFSQTNNCNQPLPQGGSCKFQVTFTPSATGPRNAAIVITDNAQNGQQTVPLRGNGVLPAVTFTPASLTFPAQLVFTKSAAQKVTLTNSGLGILAISNINLTGGSFSQTNNCGTTLVAGGSCAFSVTFLPTLKGKATGSVAVTDNAPASPQSFALTGTGTVIKVDPTSLNFGTQPVGTSSLPLTVTLSNKGHQAVTMDAIGFVGGAAHDFSQTNTCGSSLPSGASCFIYVTFTPTAKGYRKATLGIKDNGGGSPQQVSLEGYGT